MRHSCIINIIKNPSFGWDEDIYSMKNIQKKLDTVDNLKNEEFMLRNTYLNSLSTKIIQEGKNI